MLRTGQAQGGRVLVKRGGCFALELVADSVIDALLFDGLYLFFDRDSLPYAGRSNNVNGRLTQHEYMKKLTDRARNLLARIPVHGATLDELKALEEWVIQTVMRELDVDMNDSLFRNGVIANQRHEMPRNTRGNLSKIIKFC